MDRFKFRIWDIKKHKYRQGTANLADTCLDCLLGKVLYGEGIEIYGEEDDCDVILEQCTGLKDTNGKLIYDGDILKSNNTILKVFWWSELGSFAFKKEKSIYTMLQQNIALCGFEVIGNIHQNKDLLEN